tara:strand:+ start:10 stop:285 length:276 start_codon:yes stop_codon:yes gene_type:complete
MKSLKKFIREAIDDMLTFKGGILSDSNEYLEVTPEDRVKAMTLFAQSDSSDFSYKYHHLSSQYPEGVLVTCNHSGRTYLVSHTGNVVEFKG